MEFCVLASGSSGNASLARHEGSGLLIDLGLNPRRLERAFDEAGTSWSQVRAVLLTHTHSDHYNEAACAALLERRIPLCCHPRQARELARPDSAFHALQQAGLVRFFDLDAVFAPLDGWKCLAFSLPHDGGLTCGFRLRGGPATLGYAADLGSWHPGIAQRLRDVDILALEFNHDEVLQRESGRPQFLIRRVLGVRGHLSNHQAACLVREVMKRSSSGKPSRLVQLHLSRDCNRPELAQEAAAKLGAGIQIETALPNKPLNWLRVQGRDGSDRLTEMLNVRQAFLPGWEA